MINLIDTPGHIDFSGRVTRSLRAIDGAIVVVDAVEEVMIQTETVTRQALEERVRPLLFINKIDRLIKELRLPPDQIQEKLVRIIRDFNRLIEMYAEPEYREKWKVSPTAGSVAFGSARDRWGFTLAMAQKRDIKFSDVVEAYEKGRVDELKQVVPVEEAILDMVIEHIPPPHVAQRYRVPKIWRGDLESEIGQAMLNCDENGPAVMCVTNVLVDPHAGVVATGRLFSGTLHEGDTIYLIGARRSSRIQQVGIYMGQYRDVVEALPAGNIPALLGVEGVKAGETIATTKDVVPFEQIRYISEPVMTIAIEPKHPRDLPRLVDFLNKLTLEDPTLVAKIDQESGEYLLSGMGQLHLEIATHWIKKAGIDIVTSPPIVIYRETIRKRAGPFEGKSPNKHNRIYIEVEPLEPEIIELIRKGEIGEYTDRKTLAKILRDHGWDTDEARGVWAVDEKGNILIDLTKGVQFLHEVREMISAGFYSCMEDGPLARELVRGIKVKLVDAQLHEDPAHRGYAQIVPATRHALYAAMLSADPIILEPVQKITVKVPVEYVGVVTRIISQKRGRVITIEQREYVTQVIGEIPAAETFDLAEVLRGGTGGRAFWGLEFSSWQPVPASMQAEVIAAIRRRKGLSPEPPKPEDFIER